MSEVKLKDIAEALGVSTVTVSNALSGKKGVSEELRNRIENAARSMGYDFSRYERKETGATIGVIASHQYIEIGNSFYWAMYQQVICAAAKKQSVTMLEILDMELQNTKELPRILKERAVDGLIVIGWMFEPYIRNLVTVAEVPVVLLDFRVRGLACDSVMSGNFLGMYKAVRYLIERGHRDIAFVGSVLANENIMDRYYGYKKALMEAGIRERKEWILEDRDLITGQMKITLPENMPTAFACNGDWTAQWIYEALCERGYRIPQDVSIIGYDNYLPSHSFAQELTSYNVDMKRMSEVAVKRLLDKIQGKESEYETRYIDSGIVERSSVKCLDAKRVKRSG